MMMGVLSLQACTRYKIREVSIDPTYKVYIATKRDGIHWIESYQLSPTIDIAKSEIDEWNKERLFIKENKRKRYIKYGN